MSSSSGSGNRTFMYSDLPKLHAEIVYKDVTDNKNGGQSQYAQLKTGGFIFVQLDKSPANLESDRPRTTLPFGISKPLDATKLDSNRKDVPISLNHAEDIEKAIREFEEEDMKAIARDSKLLFKKELPLSTIQAKYTSGLRKDAEGKYPTRLATKINTTGNLTPQVLIYRGPKQLEKGSWRDLDQKGVTVLSVVRYAGRYFSSGKFGPVWEQANVIVFPRENQSSSFMFAWQGDMPEIVDSSTTNNNNNNVPAPAPQVPDASVAPPPIVHDFAFSPAVEN